MGAMDREISRTERRSRRLRRLLGAGLAVAGLIGGYLVLNHLFRPSAERRRIQVETVARGAIDETLEASGTVVPGEERLMTSAVDARVLKVLRHAGAAIEPGDPIVQLDVSSVALDRETLSQQLALKRNQQRRVRLEVEQRLTDLAADEHRQQLSLAFLEMKAQQRERLHAEGLSSQDDLAAVQLEVDQARASLQHLVTSRELAKQTASAQLADIDLEMALLDKRIASLDERLHQATTKSEFRGILTWAGLEPGAWVRSGDVIARIADLGAFRIKASLSDVHVARVAAGMPAYVSSGAQRLRGHVATVLPAVENGAVLLMIDLDPPVVATLRPQQRVDVEVVISRREPVLMARRGPGLTGSIQQSALFVEGDRALRRPIRIGLTNTQWCELREGAREGDQLIVSDTARWDGIETLYLY